MAAVSISELPQSQVQELICSYAALVLSDGGVPVTSENIKKIISAAGGSVEPYFPGLFAQALSTTNVADIVASCGAASVAVPAAGGAGAGAAKDSGASAAAADDKKKKEEEEEEEGDLGFSLFD
ncbi:60s Acidic ribosomal protein family protein [Cryptosporidium meleagridis]|uniref:60s Acidic ribosomal protein family protein n=1 Tax=Cryptosporidium meleagridis TaxID=93969 RepID=A0A2P4Z307_9CRYT|nr:60s Acidic ribosomal protein family protein [Cryptosporidium meleagridis]